MNQPDSSNVIRGRAFATTSWSRVVSAGQENLPQEAEQALAELCEVYWFPLYAFVRRKNFAREDAEDLTQAFFVDLLKSNKIALADADRGKFRTFLLAMLTNFISNWQRDKNALKRGGGTLPFSLDFDAAEERFEKQPGTGASAEQSFERSWAMELLASALASVQEHYESSGKGKLFELLRPNLVGDPSASMSDLASELGMTEGAVKVSLHRLRQKYGDQLRLQIFRTVSDRNEVDDELRDLFRALG